MSKQTQPSQELIAAGQRLYQQGLVCAASGNLSCRLPDGTVLITAAATCLSELKQEDILLLDQAGNLLSATAGRQASSETALHLALYRADPHIAAIAHAHPPHATALASAGLELDWQLLEESRLLLGPVPLAPRLAAGSAELAQAAAAAAPGAKALLLAGHGAVSWGHSIEAALFRLEVLEHTARVMLLHRLYSQGGPHV